MSIDAETLARHHPETIEFWNQLAQGRLMVRFCRNCGDAHWYPRGVCPFCFSADTEWREGSGKGAIYSYSVMRRASPPYAMAFVTLEEGPTMMTNVIGDVDSLAIGRQVVLAPVRNEAGLTLPFFALA